MTDFLSTFVETLRRPPPELTPSELPTEPEQLTGFQRTLKVVEAPDIVRQAFVSVEEAREIIQEEMMEYAQLVRPQHMLLIKAVPGVGKTTAAMRLAERMAAQGRRVLYAAPRHDFIHDLRAMISNQKLIYEWLPRQEGNEHKPQTCRHTAAIHTWLGRGYGGTDFCSHVCGWDYVNQACPYHAQKKHAESIPIIMGQHAHVTLGHPMMKHFDVVIGDESPLTAFQRQWQIPARYLMPANMDLTEPLAEILRELSQLADAGLRIEGPALIRALGGAQRILAACQVYTIPTSAVAYLPPIHVASDADKAPYFHLPHLVKLLTREAEAEQEGREFPHRIVIDNGQLMLLLRRHVNPLLPDHVVWLDATGNEHLYEAAFQRRVKVVEPPVRLRGRIIQVTDRLNNKRSLVEDGEATGKASQLTEQIKRIIEENELHKPGIVSFQEFVTLGEFEQFKSLHFYAARGTNVQQGVDGHIVAGTPQPSDLEIDKLARMLFFDRDIPFNRLRVTKEVPYHFVDDEGKGRVYPVSGFWHDDDLQALLWQFREAELIQSVHRSRLATRDVTVWLLSNLPIWELPPTELLQIRELFDAPPGVDVYLWKKVVHVAEGISDAKGHVTAADLVTDLGINRDTASKYIDLLVKQFGWIAAAVPATSKRKGGRPAKGARKKVY